MNASRGSLTNTEYVWRFLAWWIGALGLLALGVTYAWFYWYIVRLNHEWCTEYGPFGDAAFSEETWWPLGAECDYESLGTFQVPAWEPTLVVLGGFTALVIAVAIPLVQAAARRRRPDWHPTTAPHKQFLWRFWAGWLGVVGIFTIGVTFLWHWWNIVRTEARQWCVTSAPPGYDTLTGAEVTWWPLGAVCTYGSVGAVEVPGWGPTFVTLAGVAAMAIAVGVPVVQDVMRKRRAARR